MPEETLPEETPQIELIFSDEFRSRLRALNKRYRNIRSDLQPLLDSIQSGEFPGDLVPNTGSTVFKTRLKNSDTQKGKSGGYRVIYQLRNQTCVLLVVIYSKSDQDNFPADRIREIIATPDP